MPPVSSSQDPKEESRWDPLRDLMPSSDDSGRSPTHPGGEMRTPKGDPNHIALGLPLGIGDGWDPLPIT